MDIRLTPADGVPLYRQIVSQVKYLVAAGRLRPGQELPPIRSLAERLLVNPNTIVHAYSELVKEGVLVSKHGSGTFVAESVTRSPSRPSVQSLVPKADSLLTDALHLDLPLTDVLQLLRDRHELLKNQAPR